MTSQWTLYVLRLQSDDGKSPRWYVGITEDYEQRIRAHRNGYGHNWTKQHTVVGDYRILRHPATNFMEYLECNLTRVLTQEFGRGTTRGGDLASENPGPWDEEIKLHPVLTPRLAQTNDEELRSVARSTKVSDEPLLEREVDLLSESDPDSGATQQSDNLETSALDSDDVVQKNLHVRPMAWRSFGIALDEAKLTIRREYGLHDIEKRELQDAALRVIAERPTRIAEEFVETRKER